MLDRLGHRHWKARPLPTGATQHDKHTMKKTTLHLGLDAHKDSIAIAIAEDGRDGEVRFYGAKLLRYAAHSR